jgi:hypothetical protein
MTSNTYYPQSIDWTSEGKGDTLKTRGTGPDHRHQHAFSQTLKQLQRSPHELIGPSGTGQYTSYVLGQRPSKGKRHMATTVMQPQGYHPWYWVFGKPSLTIYESEDAEKFHRSEKENEGTVLPLSSSISQN